MWWKCCFSLMLLGFAGFWLVQLSGPPFLCERRGMHKIEGWSKVRGGGPKWRIQGLWAILSRSDYELEPAESWGRLSLNEWSPQGFPPKKIWHFLYLTLAPQTTKKKCQWKKKLNESLPPPFDSRSQCVALVLPLDLCWGLPPQLLGPFMSDLSLLHSKMVIM